MSLFPSNAYDAWKTTPDPEPEVALEDRSGYDPDAENDADSSKDEENQ